MQFTGESSDRSGQDSDEATAGVITDPEIVCALDSHVLELPVHSKAASFSLNDLAE
jgi:hypothetical protein